MSKLRRASFYLAVAVLVAAISEVAFLVGGRILQAKWAMWRVPGPAVAASEQISFDEYMRIRDPILGWPYPREYGANLTASGAQRNPLFPDESSDTSCVSLYGDSFTQGGDTTSPDKNWGNVLSRSMNCYVANFGVGGYGTDQAYLRFRENTGDRSPIVVFGVHPADVTRNLTRVRDLENYGKWFALKPRFVLVDGELTLVPIPILTEDEYLRVLTELPDQLILEHENLHPGGPAGAVKLQFPYTLAVVRNMLTFHGFKGRVLRYPPWMPFLERDHPLHGLEITAEITREFVRLAETRGQRAVVIVLPHPADFEYFLRTGVWPYGPLVEEFTSLGLLFIDFGPYLLSVARADEVSLDDYFGPTLHYNDSGNALVAKFVLDSIAQFD